MNDFIALESFDQAAVAAVAAVLGGRGRGRGRGQGAVAAVPAQAAIPGPLNLAFMDMCSMVDFADAQSGPCPLITFVRLLGALGKVATRASRLHPQSPAQRIAHALRSSSALSSGVDAATAAPPAGDTIIFSAVPQTVDSAYDALTVYLTLDKITFLGLAACCRCSTRAHLVSTPRKSSSLLSTAVGATAALQKVALGALATGWLLLLGAVPL